MPFETIKCGECGSADVTEFKPGSYVCAHCDAVFKYVAPTIKSGGSGGGLCACGTSAMGVCADCGVAVCSDHSTLGTDQRRHCMPCLALTPNQSARSSSIEKTMATCPRCGLAETVPVGKQWACAKCAAQLFWGTCVGCDKQTPVWLPGPAWQCKDCERWNWSTWPCKLRCVSCRREQLVPGFPSSHRCVNPQCQADVQRLMCSSCGRPTVVWFRRIGRRRWKCPACHAEQSPAATSAPTGPALRLPFAIALFVIAILPFIGLAISSILHGSVPGVIGLVVLLSISVWIFRLTKTRRA